MLNTRSLPTETSRACVARRLVEIERLMRKVMRAAGVRRSPREDTARASRWLGGRMCSAEASVAEAASPAAPTAEDASSYTRAGRWGSRVISHCGSSACSRPASFWAASLNPQERQCDNTTRGASGPADALASRTPGIARAISKCNADAVAALCRIPRIFLPPAISPPPWEGRGSTCR